MAQITASFRLVVNNSGYNEQVNPGALAITQNGIGAQAGVLSVPFASSVNLPVGNVTTNGLLYLQNLDPTNYVLWGPNVSGSIAPIGKVKPGELAFFRLDPGITLSLQANTAAVNVQYLLLED